MRIYFTMYSFLGATVLEEVATNPKDLIADMDFTSYYNAATKIMAIYYADIKDGCLFKIYEDYANPYYGITYDETNGKYLFWVKGEQVMSISDDDMRQSEVRKFLKHYSLE